MSSRAFGRLGVDPGVAGGQSDPRLLPNHCHVIGFDHGGGQPLCEPKPFVGGYGLGHMTCYTFGKPYLPTFHMAFKANITRAEVPTSIKESCCGNMAIRRV